MTRRCVTPGRHPVGPWTPSSVGPFGDERSCWYRLCGIGGDVTRVVVSMVRDARSAPRSTRPCGLRSQLRVQSGPVSRPWQAARRVLRRRRRRGGGQQPVRAAVVDAESAWGGRSWPPPARLAVEVGNQSESGNVDGPGDREVAAIGGSDRVRSQKFGDRDHRGNSASAVGPPRDPIRYAASVITGEGMTKSSDTACSHRVHAGCRCDRPGRTERRYPPRSRRGLVTQLVAQDLLSAL